MCLTCKGCPKIEGMPLDHLKDVHGIEPGSQGFREIVSHADGRDFHTTVFRWTFGDVQLRQSIKTQRTRHGGRR